MREKSSKSNRSSSIDFSRRDFLKMTAGTLAMGMAASVPDYATSQMTVTPKSEKNVGAKVSPKPYNVLFMLTDQERFMPDLLYRGVWPGRYRLLKMGTSFENHQICSAVCTPSRSVIFTGQHIQHTRMFDNTGMPWTRDMSYDLPTIGHMMRDAGYYTTYHGKWHLSAKLHREIGEGDPELFGFEEMDKYGFSDYNGLGDGIGMTLGGYHYDEISTATAQGWLRRKGKELNEKDKPWFMALGLVNPHDVMFYDTDTPDKQDQKATKPLFPIAREPDDKNYNHKWDYPLSPTRKEAWDAPGRPPAHHEYQKCRDTLVGAFPNEDNRWKRLQDYYLNCISDSDRSVNVILDELESLGFLENTIVIFTSDHGELCGAHGMHGKGATAFKEQNNVPFLVYHPDVQGGGKCQAVTSHLDLVPTILAMTGADKKQKATTAEKLHGHDISPLLNSPGKQSPDAIRNGALYCYSMWSYMDSDWIGKVAKMISSGKKPNLEEFPEPDLRKRSAIRTVFDGRYKFSRYFNMTQHNQPTSIDELFKVNDIELFDLQKDPFETDNLALDKKKNHDLILAMNDKLNRLIDEEAGEDDGSFLPKIENVTWSVDKMTI